MGFAFLTVHTLMPGIVILGMMPDCRGAAAVFCLFCASVLPAGVVGGTVLEHATGYPMARARVRLDRINTTGRVESASVLSGRTGAFTFANVADGLYVLSATRSGYAPGVYGQRRPEGFAPPFAVEKDTNLFAELRLRKFGAISGQVLDENRIGIAGVSVSAYPLAPPFRSVASGVSDDRGAYRLHGLAAGRYRVRTAPFRHDDGLALLPTFGPESLAMKDSALVETRLDQETAQADVTPISGALISLSGSVTCASNVPAGPVTVTISHETIRRTVITACQTRYRVDNLPPGAYELFAIDSTGRVGAFVENSYHQSASNATLELRELNGVRLGTYDETGRMAVEAAGSLTLRRVDLSGIAETREVELSGRTAPLVLALGHWEISGALRPPFHITAVHPAFIPPRTRANAHPDRFEFPLERYTTNVILRTSRASGSIRGRVVEAGLPMPGISVFLWPADPQTRRLSQGTRVAVASRQGEFGWESLRPGEYRLAASYDVAAETDEPVAGNTTVIVRDAAAGLQELAPIVVP